MKLHAKTVKSVWKKGEIVVPHYQQCQMMLMMRGAQPLAQLLMAGVTVETSKVAVKSVSHMTHLLLHNSLSSAIQLIRLDHSKDFQARKV